MRGIIFVLSLVTGLLMALSANAGEVIPFKPKACDTLLKATTPTPYQMAFEVAERMGFDPESAHVIATNAHRVDQPDLIKELSRLIVENIERNKAVEDSTLRSEIDAYIGYDFETLYDAKLINLDTLIHSQKLLASYFFLTANLEVDDSIEYYEDENLLDFFALFEGNQTARLPTASAFDYEGSLAIKIDFINRQIIRNPKLARLQRYLENFDELKRANNFISYPDYVDVAYAITFFWTIIEPIYKMAQEYPSIGKILEVKDTTDELLAELVILTTSGTKPLTVVNTIIQDLLQTHIGELVLIQRILIFSDLKAFYQNQPVFLRTFEHIEQTAQKNLDLINDSK